MSVTKSTSLPFNEGVTPVAGLTSGKGISDSGVKPKEFSEIIFDTFTDSDNTRLQDHTPEKDTSGLGWSEASGTWEIQGNTTGGTGLDPAGLGWLSVIDSTETDIVIKTESTFGPTGMVGVVTHYIDSNNFYYSILTGGGILEIHQAVTGVLTRISFIDTNSAPTGTVELIATRAGNMLYLEYGGYSVFVKSITAGLTSSIVGINSYQDISQRSVDLFSAKKLEDVYLFIDFFDEVDTTLMYDHQPYLINVPSRWDPIRTDFGDNTDGTYILNKEVHPNPDNALGFPLPIFFDLGEEGRDVKLEARQGTDPSVNQKYSLRALQEIAGLTVEQVLLQIQSNNRRLFETVASNQVMRAEDNKSIISSEETLSLLVQGSVAEIGQTGVNDLLVYNFLEDTTSTFLNLNSLSNNSSKTNVILIKKLGV